MRGLRLLFLVCLLLFTGLLSGCSAFTQVPPDQVVRMAITRQLSHTQQTIAQDLGLLVSADNEELKPNFRIDKITVETREKVTNSEVGRSEVVQNQNIKEIYRVRGSFEAKLTGSKTKQPPISSPFDLYLGTNSNEADDLETWFLLAD
ncbi:MAG: hypothetical protein AAF716_05775 [Cyanobacteria bacterium P01_D01_bin.1]